MDRSLARGYAKRFLDQLTPHGSVLAWHDSPRKVRALDSFSESSLSKKPGRVLERLRPLVGPPFGSLNVVNWSRKGETIVSALSVSSARESAVLHPDDQGRTLFDERSAFLNHLVFRSRGLDAVVYGATTAGIGGHAVGRLLERKMATPDTLREAVFQLLYRANCLQIGLERSGLDPDRPWGLIVPVPGGAAGAVTHRVRPWPDARPDHVDLVASVRTVLREDMLSPEQKDRMAGFDEVFDSLKDGPEPLEAWIRRNARPWVQNAVEVTPAAAEMASEPELAMDDPSPF